MNGSSLPSEDVKICYRNWMSACLPVSVPELCLMCTKMDKLDILPTLSGRCRTSVLWIFWNAVELIYNLFWVNILWIVQGFVWMKLKMVYQVGTMDKDCDNSGIWDDVNSYICCHHKIHKWWAHQMIMLQQKTIFISLTLIFIQIHHIFSLGYSTSNMTDSLQSWTQSSI